MISGVRQNYRVLLPGLLLAASSLVVLAFLGNLNEVSLFFSNFKWEYFGLAIAINIFHHAVRFLNLSLSLNFAGIKSIPFRKRLTFYLSSSALNAADQRINDTIKSVWVSKTCGIPLNRTGSAFLTDDISRSITVLVLAILGVIAYPNFWPLFLALLCFFILMILFLQIQPAGDDLLDAGEKIPSLRQMILRLRAMFADNRAMFRPIPFAISMLLNILAWIAMAVALFFILLGLGLPADLAIAAIACLVLGFAIIAGMLSKMPGGLGVVELALAGLLSILLGYQPEMAVTATILFRLSTFWISLLFGILFWPTAAKSCSVEAGSAIVQS